MTTDLFRTDGVVVSDTGGSNVSATARLFWWIQRCGAVAGLDPSVFSLVQHDLRGLVSILVKRR